jgi:prepilin-type processing-associated H-X9-DG protein
MERGQSNTLLVGERTASQCSSAWIGFAVAGEDAAARVVGCAATAPNNPNADESEFSSRHPGCANFLWADGHVSAIANSVDSQAYRCLAQRVQVATQP